MKKQNMEIDINRLDTPDLERLARMFYGLGMMDKVKQVNDRIAFLEGWMSEAKEKEYFETWCM